MLIASFNLNQPIDCNLLCQKIQMGLSRIIQDIGDPNNKLLTVIVSDINDGNLQETKYYIEHKS